MTATEDRQKPKFGESLDRLDRRLAPWAQRRPELIGVLVAALFLAGAATHLQRYQRGETAPGGDSADFGLSDAPHRRGAEEDYIAAREAELAQLAASDPEVVLGAVVSLAAYLTPAQVGDLVSSRDVDVTGARLRLRTSDAPGMPAGTDPLPRGRVSIDADVIAQVAAGLTNAAARAREQAADLDELARTTEDPAFAELFRADRDLLLAAASVEPAQCRCIHALEVRASARILQRLARDPRIRLVDVVSPGSPTEVRSLRAVTPD